MKQRKIVTPPDSFVDLDRDDTLSERDPLLPLQQQHSSPYNHVSSSRFWDSDETLVGTSPSLSSVTRLSTRLRSNHPDQTGWEDLPVKIVIMVADLVDLPSASALSLTCKTLHSKLKFLYSGLSRTTAPYLERQQIERDRMEFLRRLERDSPNTGPLCHYCRLLGHHPVDRWYSYGPEVSRSCSSDFRFSPSCLSFGPWPYRLEFHQAYMVLNRHLYGASFGLPLSSLSKTTDWQAKTPLDALWEHPGTFQRSGWFRKLDVEANIQDNQIFLHTCQRIWFPPKQRDSLRKHGLGGIYARACPHTIARTNQPSVRSAIDSSLSRLPEKANRETSKELPAKSNGELHQCPSCPTEFAVSICDDSEYGIEIIFDVWHNLGSCRAFDDLGWVNVVEGFRTMVDVRQDITFHDKRWLESCRNPPYVSCVMDAVPGLPVSASAMEHPSSRAVLQAWGRPNHLKRRIAVLKPLLWKKAHALTGQLDCNERSLRKVE